MVGDRSSGAIITWGEHRTGDDWDIYAQSIDPSGTPFWRAEGIGVCLASGDQNYPVIASDEQGGAFLAWLDFRNGSSSDIYAQWLDDKGYSYPAPTISSIQDIPNDQGGQVRISWFRSLYDHADGEISITNYGIYRRIPDALAGPAGGSNGCREEAPLLTYPPGDWDYVTTVPAAGEEDYNCVVPTLCDSTVDGMCRSVFFMRAMTPDPAIHFDSQPDSGYSVDNLSPSVPGNFVWNYPAELTWDESEDADFDYFTIYGSDHEDLDENAVLIGYTTGTDSTSRRGKSATCTILSRPPISRATRESRHSCRHRRILRILLGSGVRMPSGRRYQTHSLDRPRSRLTCRRPALPSSWCTIPLAGW
ncbi:MAG: hypothetical protein ABIG68_07180 [Acidobacteriota bacterium]